MEFHLPNHLSVESASVIALLIFLYYLLKWRKNKDDRRKPPEPAGSWPVIGHLHLLGRLPHIFLGNAADKYGPILMIKLGVRRALVVSSPEMVKECIGDGDKVFVNRPHTIFVDQLAYNSAMMGFTPYNEHWREMRKITTLKLLSNHQLEMSKHVRTSEVRSAVRAILAKKKEADSDTGLVDMKQWFSDINLNIMVKLIAGKSLKEFKNPSEVADQFRQTVIPPPASKSSHLTEKNRTSIGAWGHAPHSRSVETEVRLGWTPNWPIYTSMVAV